MRAEKTVNYSRVIMSHVVLPQDANPLGNVHGGVIMKHIDNAAGVVAIRHSRTTAVTASIDRLDFHNPAYVGNLLTLKAGLNMVGKSSMEVGVRVEAEDLISGETKHIVSAYLSFVAIDENHIPLEVPLLKLKTNEEKRRNRDAMARKKTRIREKKKEKECQENIDNCPK